jgi:hypothetical protein
LLFGGFSYFSPRFFFKIFLQKRSRFDNLSV